MHSSYPNVMKVDENTLVYGNIAWISTWSERNCRFFIHSNFLGIVANFWHTSLAYKNCMYCTRNVYLYLMVSLGGLSQNLNSDNRIWQLQAAFMKYECRGKKSCFCLFCVLYMRGIARIILHTMKLLPIWKMRIKN